MHLNPSSPLKAEMAEVLFGFQSLSASQHPVGTWPVRVSGRKCSQKAGETLGMTPGTLWALVHSPAVS